jgi:hypothetical protein
MNTFVGVLRHPHGDPDPDAGSDDPDGVPQIDVLQEAVLLVLLGIGAVDKADRQGDGGHIASGIELCLRCFPHGGVALSLRFLVVAAGDFLGF